LTLREAQPPALVLALDTGSPVSSVAVARGGRVLAETAIERDASSPTLIAEVDAVLARIGACPAAIGAVCVLRGPGSFTGLRIGLATALGLHQALGVRVAAMPTLRVLAEASRAAALGSPSAFAGAAGVTAVVDALRGEWFVQTFLGDAGEFEAAGPPVLARPESLPPPASHPLIGFGAARLAAIAGFDPARAFEPPPLAAVAALLAPRWPVWDAALLTEPLYLRAAPVTPPPRRALETRRSTP
jgi:tRNA threonylcarbamoyladenosine biosynthesis protein TsaB